MYEQAEPVRSPVSGSGSGRTTGPPSQPPTVHLSASRGRARYGKGATYKREEDQETSDTYEEAEALKRGATFTSEGEAGVLKAPGGAFSSGFGDRFRVLNATGAFRTTPVVTVGLGYLDHSVGHIRVMASVESVTTTNLTVRIGTWYDSGLYSASIHWMACA
uniref:H-type lectin domain-containing protein n=1 Tax=Branchiostoma floridae TaxID=7739 RepID=C3XSZ6_BRAFL|eukprot:XP_002612855.1 hypothetical protein BRAFLDRAFT_67195 [Branchiostoma floridae]